MSPQENTPGSPGGLAELAGPLISTGDERAAPGEAAIAGEEPRPLRTCRNACLLPMASLPSRLRASGPVFARIAAALFGGYALAALVSVAALALPVGKPQAVLGGMLVSFVIYAGAVIWAFAARSALRAWAGLLLAAAPLLVAAGLVWWR